MKTKFLTLLLLAFIGLSTAKAQVGIGTTDPHASAKLEVSSTDKGFLPPRMSTTDRDAIDGPTAGLVIYNTTTSSLQFSDGTNWVDLVDASTTATTGTEPTSGSGDVGIGTNTPNVNAILDVESTTQGFLPPRLTTAERNVISSPAEGLTIFNTDVNCLQWYNGTGWFDACDGTTDEIVTSGKCLGEPVEITFNGLTYKPIEYDNNCWLDRNLGANRVAQSFDDFQAYGDLYQWGRSNDGHQLINWTSSTAGTPVNTPASTSTSTSPSPGNTFIDLGAFTGNWYTGTTPPPNNLWKQDGTGTNNPCPPGYRVPTLTEMDFAISNYGSGLAANATNNPLKLPAVGYRRNNNANLQDTSSEGNYWTSTSSGTNNAHRISYSGGSISSSALSKAYGYSVRCLKE